MTSTSSTSESDDLFDSSFRLPSFDGNPTVPSPSSITTTTTLTTTSSSKAQSQSQYYRSTINTVKVPSILVTSPPAPPSRSLLSRFSLVTRDSPSSTPSYVQPNQRHLTLSPTLSIVNPLRRRSATVTTAEADDGAKGAGGRGKGGPGWYAGKRKNEKGEIVAIGEDGVEVVIMKLPIQPKKTPTPPRPSVHSPSPHPAPSIPLPPIPTSAAQAPNVVAPVPEDISDDISSTLIREMLSRSSSRESGDGSGCFEVCKERISSDLGVGGRPTSIVSCKGERRRSILQVASEIVEKELRSTESLTITQPSNIIVEEDENQRTPIPALSSDASSLSNQSISTPSVPARTSSLPSPSPPSPPPPPPRRPMAFGTRSSTPSSTPRSSPTHPSNPKFDDLRPGSPAAPTTKYTIVAHNASPPSEVFNVESTIVVSPQAWAEQVAEYHHRSESQEVTLDGPRRESILWEEEGGYNTVSASSSTAVAPSSSMMMINHATRRRVSISPSFESSTSTHASSSASTSSSSQCCFHHGRGSFSSSSDTCPSSAPTSSSAFALTSSSSSSSSSNPNKKQLHLNLTTSHPPPSSTTASSTTTSERSHKQALLSLRRLHSLEKDALIFALSESKRALDDARAETEDLRGEVRDLRGRMEEIRRALIEEELAAAGGGGGQSQSVYGTASEGQGRARASASAVSLLSLSERLSTLDGMSTSSTGGSSVGMSRGKESGSGSTGWEDGEEEEEEEEEGGMGELLRSFELPPTTVPSRRSLVVEG
ncbi:hypothetical protein BDY24DRAFT_416280 [Mrakia frigida]|uniref:uncharacterized protein n=1 Tax=Mrakia frigida TaxID=29902 RepID=UPI003FCC22EB